MGLLRASLGQPQGFPLVVALLHSGTVSSKPVTCKNLWLPQSPWQTHKITSTGPFR
uniref:Uncharacterized protein n=1 Tax=Arundo donax TaxID=35708 RepID=A0A0A8YG65_ARUDO